MSPTLSYNSRAAPSAWEQSEFKYYSDNVIIAPNVYNGINKITENEYNFMRRESVMREKKRFKYLVDLTKVMRRMVK